MTIQEKFAESRKSIERLHPGHGKELEKPMYVGWGKVEYNEGSWIRSYAPDVAKAPGMTLTRQTGQARNASIARTESNPAYEALIQPDGPFIFVGDHASHIVGWQEGAALSAIRAVGIVSDKVKAARLASAPNVVTG